MRKLFLLALASFILAFLGAAGSALAQTATLTATVRPNPLELELMAPQNVVVGEWFDISASVSNKGGEVIRKTWITLNTPGEIVARGVKKNLGDLQPGETRTVNWRAKANSAGKFVVMAQVTGKLAGEPISASDTALISATSPTFLVYLFSFFTLD